MICMVLPDLRGGGAERVSLDLARGIANKGYEVEFALMSARGEFLPQARQGFRVIDLDAERARNVPQCLARYMGTRRPKIVMAHMWPLTSASVIARALSGHACALALVEHGVLSKQYASWSRLDNFVLRSSMRLTYRFADHVVAVSEGGALDTAQLAGLAANRVHVVHNPIPQRPLPQADACADAHALWNCPQGERILTVGSLKEPKNQSLLLQAFARLNRPEARLMLLGQGEKEAALRTLASELGIADRVIFAGFHVDPAPFYATADVFVLSSDHEGFGNVLVEALSFGLPVVSTDCPSGPAEILSDRRWGTLVPVADPDLLAQAIDHALATPVDPSTLKKRAADFSPEIATSRYLEILGLS